MKILPVAIAAALLTGACTPPRPAVAVSQPGAPCGLTVSFGSYAMGIDQPTLAAVEAALAGDLGARAIERRHWGREGEVTLCVTLRRDADGRRLFGVIKPLIPANPRGPVTVSTSGGLEYVVSNPPG